MTCTAKRRQRAREAADALRACESVLAVDVLAPATGPQDGWSIEATAEIVDEAVLRTAARHDLALPEIAPQGDWRRAVFVLA